IVTDPYVHSTDSYNIGNEEIGEHGFVRHVVVMRTTILGCGPVVWGCVKFFDAKPTIRSRMRLIKDIKELLEMNPTRLSLFSESCFGVWLNVPFKDHEPFLIHSMLLNQQEVDEHHTEHHDLQFNVYNYILKFGRREFCICTGMKFGHYDLKPFDSARVVPFRDRVFGHANVTVRHLKEAFDGDEWHNINDVDVVRLCLVMFVEFVLLGREPKNKTHVHLLALVEDLDVFNQFPWGSYTWNVLYKSIRNAAWIHYRRVNVGDGAVEGGGKVGWDIGVKMSSVFADGLCCKKNDDLNFHEDDAMDDSNFGLNSGWLNSMSTPQGQFQVFSTPDTQVNMAPQFQDPLITPVYNSTTIRDTTFDVVMEDVLREKQPGRIKKKGWNLLPHHKTHTTPY
ncbi:phospholipase-like protein, partial [Tanacetum coccineum]